MELLWGMLMLAAFWSGWAAGSGWRPAGIEKPQTYADETWDTGEERKRREDLLRQREAWWAYDGMTDAEREENRTR